MSGILFSVRQTLRFDTHISNDCQSADG